MIEEFASGVGGIVGLALELELGLLQELDRLSYGADSPAVCRLLPDAPSPEHAAATAWARSLAIERLNLPNVWLHWFEPATSDAADAGGGEVREDGTDVRFTRTPIAALAFARTKSAQIFIVRGLSPADSALLVFHEAKHIANHGTPCSRDYSGCDEPDAQAFAASFTNTLAGTPWEQSKGS